MSSSPAIRIENLYKRYQIGVDGKEHYTSLRDVMSDTIKRMNPLQSRRASRGKADSRVELIALAGIDIEISKGEKIGIIGRNGAGKSTLLKILSRITEPTSGRISLKGRIACLLEVGTGFHPELTGRENIYLNGAILGLKRVEVKERFDEIVAFSEIGQFLDTPVKRYSSGMHSRLAFSVAAHLNSEILIVDEVLAVGDVHFQKKCMGKMGELSSKEGRTVIFVSHNMQAVQNLCTKALLLSNGKLVSQGNPKEVVKKYIQTGENQQLLQEWNLPDLAPGNDIVRMKRISIRPQGKDTSGIITVHTPIVIEFHFWSFIDKGTININLELYTVTSECVFNMGSHSVEAEKGIGVVNSTIPANLLNCNTYYINITIIKNNSLPIFTFGNCITFEVADEREGIDYYGPWPGIIRPQLDTYLYFMQIVNHE